MLRNGVTNTSNSGLQPSIEYNKVIWKSRNNQPKPDETIFDKKWHENQEKINDLYKIIIQRDANARYRDLKPSKTDVEKILNNQAKDNNQQFEKPIENKQSRVIKQTKVGNQYGAFSPLLELEGDELPNYKKTKKTTKHNKRKQTNVKQKENNELELVNDQNLRNEVIGHNEIFYGKGDSWTSVATAYPIVPGMSVKINISNHTQGQSLVEMEIGFFEFYPLGCSAIKTHLNSSSKIEVHDQCDKFSRSFDSECSKIPKEFIEKNQQDPFKPSIIFNTTTITPKEKALLSVATTMNEIKETFYNFERFYRKNNTSPTLDHANYYTNIHRAFWEYKNRFLKNCAERPLPGGKNLFWKYVKNKDGRAKKVELLGGNGDITASQSSIVQFSYLDNFINEFGSEFRNVRENIRNQFNQRYGEVSYSDKMRSTEVYADFLERREKMDKQLDEESRNQRERDEKERDETYKKLNNTEKKLNETTTELNNTEKKLNGTTIKLSKTEKELNETATDLNKTGKKLNETTTKLSKTEKELNETATELNKITLDFKQLAKNFKDLVTGFVATTVSGGVGFVASLIAVLTMFVFFCLHKRQKPTNPSQPNHSSSGVRMVNDGVSESSHESSSIVGNNSTIPMITTIAETSSTIPKNEPLIVIEPNPSIVDVSMFKQEEGKKLLELEKKPLLEKEEVKSTSVSINTSKPK